LDAADRQSAGIVGGSSLPHFFVVNARSLAENNAVQLFQMDLSAVNIDFAAVTETWLHKAPSDFSYDINGYVMFRLDRVGRKGGGICVYVSDSMHADVLQTAKHEFGLAKTHELMWLSFVKSSMKYICGVLNHPPRAKYNINELIDR
jgi:hypothetical protein